MLNIKNTRINSKGFTLLLATLVSSLLLSVGLSMFTIAQKEIILSSLGRDSQYAFYAADSGAECALYLDFKGVFDTSAATHGATCNTVVVGEYRPPESVDLSDLVLGGESFVGGLATSEFFFELNNRCIKVEVTKFETGTVRTQINSRGYSVGCDAAGEPVQTPRTLERAVRMRY